MILTWWCLRNKCLLVPVVSCSLFIQIKFLASYSCGSIFDSTWRLTKMLYNVTNMIPVNGCNPLWSPSFPIESALKARRHGPIQGIQPIMYWLPSCHGQSYIMILSSPYSGECSYVRASLSGPLSTDSQPNGVLIIWYSIIHLATAIMSSSNDKHQF
jgi:hypothetical protein